MLPSRHLVFGILYSLIILIIFPQIGLIGFLIIIISTILIDVDHYIYYVFRKRNLNLKKAYKWYVKRGIKFQKLSKKQKNQISFGVFFLHGFEIILILFIFFVYTKIILFFFILTGFVFHQLLDLIELVQQTNNNSWKVLSLIYSLYYSKNKILLEDINHE